MSKEYNSALQTLIDIHEMSLDKFTKNHKSIKDASKIKVEPLLLNGVPTGEPFEIIFYTYDEQSVQKALLAYYGILMKEKQICIDSLKSEAGSMKVFREHRGGLAESLETTIECPNGLEDIKRHFEGNDFLKHYLSDIQITRTLIPDDRLPAVWKGGSYNVIGKFPDCDGYVVIGQCNFKE